MIPRYEVYRERIASELAQITRAAERAEHAFQAASRGEQDETLYLDAAALNLHRFYSGVERLFEWLVRELDGTVPGGPAWHHALLAQVAMQIPTVRPAIIRSTTQAALEEYLGFRHVVRNLYTWDFQSAKIADLITRLPATLHELDSDLQDFRRFLDAAGHADEIPDED